MSPKSLFLLVVIANLAALGLTFPSPINFRVIDRTGYVPGCTRYDKEIGNAYAKNYMGIASSYAWFIFDYRVDEWANYTDVTLMVESFGHVSPYIVSRSSGNAVWINADHIQNYMGNAKDEFTGILYHEMARMWQWTGNGMAPYGLLTGIADYVRLKIGRVPPEWVQRGSGSRWDEGYAVTAYFLDYCSGLDNYFVGKLNRMMKTSYDDSYFKTLLGKTVDELWSDYKTKYGN